MYQYSSIPDHSIAGPNPLTVNGIDLGSTTSSTSMLATAEGDATATGQGEITFTFTRVAHTVHLSGLAIASCQVDAIFAGSRPHWASILTISSNGRYVRGNLHGSWSINGNTLTLDWDIYDPETLDTFDGGYTFSGTYHGSTFTLTNTAGGLPSWWLSQFQVTCEPLSTLTENSFNDRGDSSLSWHSTYTYSLANGYSVDLIGWTHARSYAYGFLTDAANTNPMAIVSGLHPGGS